MRRLPALLVLCTVLLTACGNGPSYVREQDAVLKVKLDEYRIRPEFLEVHAGRVHVTATNVGRLTHNLVIESIETKVAAEPHIYGRLDTLHPGQTGHERSGIVLKPGKYRLTCTIANHDDLGQWGELKVVR
jgi:uncharacterized cupredoxin-like copper-binding protein